MTIIEFFALVPRRPECGRSTKRLDIAVTFDLVANNKVNMGRTTIRMVQNGTVSAFAFQAMHVSSIHVVRRIRIVILIAVMVMVRG